MSIDKDEEEKFDSTDMELCSIREDTIKMEKSPGDEVEKECPLCKCMIRYFFINFNEKVLLCENRECEYPFGYEDLVFVKQDEQCAVEDELESITTIVSHPARTSSIISTRDWSDIEKLNRAYDSEDSQAELSLPMKMSEETPVEEYLKETEADIETKKNLEQIKKLNMKLQSTYENDLASIRNEKWIKHLMSLQDMSGVQLLKEKELRRLKAKSEANLGSNELTIGIDHGSSISSITIALTNNSDLAMSCGKT